MQKAVRFFNYLGIIIYIIIILVIFFRSLLFGNLASLSPNLKPLATLVNQLSMITVIMLLFPIILQIIGLIKLNTAYDRESLIAIGILTLLFANFISGILLLCMRNEDLMSSTH